MISGQIIAIGDPDYLEFATASLSISAQFLQWHWHSECTFGRPAPSIVLVSNAIKTMLSTAGHSEMGLVDAQDAARLQNAIVKPVG